jgi:hypothetical protein
VTKPNLFQDTESKIYESANTYARKTGMSIRKARRTLRRLVDDKKMIFVKRNKANGQKAYTENMDDNFFASHATPFDVNSHEIGGFDILGIPEIRCSEDKPYRLFEIVTLITIGEMEEYFRKKNADSRWKHDAIMDMKVEYILRDVLLLRNMVKDTFSKELPFFSGNIVQFVKTPPSLFDLSPGGTMINYRVFTKRCLGVLDECS